MFNHKKNIRSWDHLLTRKTFVLEPKNIKDLQYFFYKIAKEKETYVIKTGECAYFDKSVGPGKYTISLKYFNSIKINKKKLNVVVESGTLMKDLIQFLYNEKYTIPVIPGSGDISVGGAISANIIGKSSSKKFSCFGDSVVSLKVYSNHKKLKNTNKIYKYVGAFGLQGMILSAKIKIIKIPSKNLLVKKKIANTFSELDLFFKENYEYKYCILNPYFSSQKLGVFFGADFTEERKILFLSKKINFKYFYFIFVFLKFINFNFFLKLFYYLFFQFSKLFKKKYIDYYNFFYQTNFSRYLAYSFKQGFVEVEILIKNIFILEKVYKFLKKEKINPKYIVLKKQYKSTNNFFYEFSDNGFSLAMTFEKVEFLKNHHLVKIFFDFLKINKINFNETKNSIFQNINFKKNRFENNIFLSDFLNNKVK